ncbi:MAG: M23 family metallopeptidase [Rhodospirillales bacterium]|nr:M23 family metallopeptidase [Rhodospirillales bacterium]
MRGVPGCRWLWARALFLIAILALAGCGSFEWPPRGRMPRDVNTPPPASAPTPAAPARADSSPAFVGAEAVVAGRGDTVYALARRHRVPVRALIEANKLSAPYYLNEGQRVTLPRGPTHTVQRGDTLYAIARQYQADPYALARANGLAPPYAIQAGETLLLPSRPPSVVADLASPAEAGFAKAGAPVASAAPPPQRTPPTTVPRPQPVTGDGFIWPVKGKVLSGFGTKAKGLRNDGINIAADLGAPVMASENGVVAYAGNELRGFGNLLLIKHSNGWVSAYAHNDRLLVKRGDAVRKGQQIATVGATGNVRNPQLHFELRRGRIAEDPVKHLRGA